MGQTTNIVGGGLKAFSAFQTGKQKSALEIANAGIADQQAKSEMDAGAYNTNLARRKAASIEGNQIASVGANNLQQTGTPSQVIASTAAAQEANALQIQNNALRRAWGFQVQGASDRFQARMDDEGGILSGIGDLAATGAKGYQLSNSGM